MNCLYTSSSKDLKRFVRQATIFLLVVLCLDQAIGSGLKKLQAITKSGYKGLIELAIEDNSDIIVFGSSRAQHHFVPDIIERETGKTFFNAGMPARKILYHFAIQQLIFEHHFPKIVILELWEPDMQRTPSGIAELSILTPFQTHPVVKEVLTERGILEPLRSLSQIYPHNSDLLTLLYALMSDHGKDRKGYEPIYGIINQDIRVNTNVDKRLTASDISDDYVAYLERFLGSALKHNIRVIVTISPKWPDSTFYTKERNEALDKCLTVVKKYNVPIFDISQDSYPEFFNPTYFHDRAHLNHNGAKLFSKILGIELRKELEDKSNTINPALVKHTGNSPL